MLTLIKNVSAYAPAHLGIVDLLVGGGKIVHISGDISPETDYMEVIDCSGLTATPGFIDQHVHIIGGGGEGSFKTRTPEITLSKIVGSGTTTVIGCLGTDGVGRHMESLLAKAKGLEEEGISTYIYSGSYEFPINTLTGSLRKDIMFLDKVVGAGEIAVSDHRSSAPSKEDLHKAAALCRVSGMLSGKVGVLHLHMGDGNDGLRVVNEILDEGDVPIYIFRPTHVNRNPGLFEESIQFALKGGIIDITSCIIPDSSELSHLKPSRAVVYCMEKGVPIERITMSSDGNASMPVFDAEGRLLRLTAADPGTIYTELKAMVQNENIPLSEAVKVITSNVADGLKLNGKGKLEPGFDADITLLDSDMNIVHVFAKGRQMLRDSEVIVKGTFEEG